MKFLQRGFSALWRCARFPFWPGLGIAGLSHRLLWLAFLICELSACAVCFALVLQRSLDKPLALLSFAALWCAMGGKILPEQPARQAPPPACWPGSDDPLDEAEDLAKAALAALAFGSVAIAGAASLGPALPGYLACFACIGAARMARGAQARRLRLWRLWRSHRCCQAADLLKSSGPPPGKDAFPALGKLGQAALRRSLFSCCRAGGAPGAFAAKLLARACRANNAALAEIACRCFDCAPDAARAAARSKAWIAWAGSAQAGGHSKIDALRIFCALKDAFGPPDPALVSRLAGSCAWSFALGDFWPWPKSPSAPARGSLLADLAQYKMRLLLQNCALPDKWEFSCLCNPKLAAKSAACAQYAMSLCPELELYAEKTALAACCPQNPARPPQDAPPRRL